MSISINIRGRKYYLSSRAMVGRDPEFGSLWILNEKKRLLLMYRVNEGNLKFSGDPRRHGRLVESLRENGQLNWVSNQDQDMVEKDMANRAEKYQRALVTSFRSHESDQDRALREAVETEWNVSIRNPFLRTFDDEWEAFQRDRPPSSFRPNGVFSMKKNFSRYYLRNFIGTQWGRDYNNLKTYLKRQGHPLEEMDPQMVDWAIQEVIDDNFRALADSEAPV